MAEDPFGFIGAVIDNRHRLDQMIGEGGFGVVYRGFHLSFEQPIAVKCLKLPAHFTTEAKALFLEKFREEGKLLAQLSQDASIVRVYDFGIAQSPTAGPVPYLALEWLEGRDLEEHLAERARRGAEPFSEQQALSFVRPAVKAIAFAHRLKIAHRDIKPANLFLARTAGGKVLKVLDFGIAKAMQEGETATQIATKTSSGFSAFSPQYGAPEQFLSKKHGATGPWTDVHALGLVLTELVAGRPALEGDEQGELMLAAIDEQRATPRACGAQVSDAFEQLCAKALARMPRDRFQDAGEMLAALDRVLGEEAAADGPGSGMAGELWPEPSPAASPDPGEAGPDDTASFIHAQGLDIGEGAAPTEPGAPAKDPTEPAAPAKDPTEPAAPVKDPTEPAAPVPMAAPGPGDAARPHGARGLAAGPPAPAPAIPEPTYRPPRSRRGLVLVALGALVAVAVVAAALLRPTAPDCGNGADCHKLGLCTPRGDGCVAASDSDCAQAEVCRELGLCTAQNGACTRSPELDPVAQDPPVHETEPDRVHVPAGRTDDQVWTPAFEARLPVEEASGDYLEAVSHCRHQGLMLCTEAQWTRACTAQPAVGRRPCWTASWDGAEVVQRGGEGCHDRARVRGSERSPERGALCCERAIGLRSPSRDADELEGYHQLQLAYERAINDQDLGALEAMWDPRGLVFDGTHMSLARARQAQQSWWRTHPEQWTMYDVCAVAAERVPCADPAGEPPCQHLVHECITVTALGRQLSVVEQTVQRRQLVTEGPYRVVELAHQAPLRPLGEL